MKLYVCYGTWRKAGKRLTGNYWVPMMGADDGTVVQESKRIAEWAQVHLAQGGGRPGSEAR